MSRRRASDGRFILRINLRSGSDVRRFSEVHIDQRDNVYVFQPRKGRSAKISYHESGQRHVKIGAGPAMFVLHLNKPEWIRTSEWVWSKSFETFESLLPYRSEPADATFEVPLPPLPYTDTLALAEVRIGYLFDPKPWRSHGVTGKVLMHQVFAIPHSPAQLCVCVQVLQLADSNR
jgi:hypothetical protein